MACLSWMDNANHTVFQVLHATPALNETLRNVYSLLKPSGRLFLEELTPGRLLPLCSMRIYVRKYSQKLDAMFVNYVMVSLESVSLSLFPQSMA